MMSVLGDLWNGIVAGLNWMLQGLYGLTGNYGLAIILLTVLVKLVLLPLTVKQTRSMIAMQKIQPEIKKLQEKYKDDKEKLSQEMMKFYKENKINPLGGCLPLLLQFPVFIALFTVLRKYLLTAPAMVLGMTFNILPGFFPAAGGIAKVVPKSADFLWVKNLADSTRIADPIFILIILLGISTWYSQKQVMTDPRQKNMMYIMPLITVFIGLSLPAGVVLYWITTNLLQIIQQWGMEYYDKKHPRELPQAKAEKGAMAAKTSAKGKATGGKKAPGPHERAAIAAKSGEERTKAEKKAAPSGAKQKQGAATGKGKGPAPKGKGKTPSQVRKPKGPPPQQRKKAPKGPSGKSASKKKR
jgi:YidC/Oxa1 family membrane protein insertase